MADMENISDAKVTRDIRKIYEVDRCITWIQENGYKKVALQFPDDLLQDAPLVCLFLKESLGFDVYILGDTSYGSCCVDEVNTDHVRADSVIHFGHACGSPTAKFPVLYVFPPLVVDIELTVEKITEICCDQYKYIIVYDTSWYHAVDELRKRLSLSNIYITELNILDNEHPKEVTKGKTGNDTVGHSFKYTFCNRNLTLNFVTPLTKCSFIYLGHRTCFLQCLLWKFPESTFYHIDPSCKVTSLSGLKSVMARSGKLEQIKASPVIGIIIGALGSANQQEMVLYMKSLIRNAGKRSYTYVIGKLNEPKVANIPDIDVFVYIACLESSVIERQVEPALYRKIVLPWELMMALHPDQDWTLSLETDFRKLLPSAQLYRKIPNCKMEDGSFSSHSGCCMSLLSIKDPESSDAGNLACVQKEDSALSLVHVGGGGEKLQHHSWRGLDISAEPLLPPTVLLEGKKGIASVYLEEGK